MPDLIFSHKKTVVYCMVELKCNSRNIQIMPKYYYNVQFSSSKRLRFLFQKFLQPETYYCQIISFPWPWFLYIQLHYLLFSAKTVRCMIESLWRWSNEDDKRVKTLSNVPETKASFITTRFTRENGVSCSRHKRSGRRPTQNLIVCLHSCPWQSTASALTVQCTISHVLYRPVRDTSLIMWILLNIRLLSSLSSARPFIILSPILS
jgi:hypothetical protein